MPTVAGDTAVNCRLRSAAVEISSAYTMVMVAAEICLTLSSGDTKRAWTQGTRKADTEMRATREHA